MIMMPYNCSSHRCSSQAVQTSGTPQGVLRERGRRHWPLERVYRLLFNPELYLLYGNIYPTSSSATLTPSGSPSSIRMTSRRIFAARSLRLAASSTACRMAADREVPPWVSGERERP